MADHDTHDHTGVPGVGGAGSVATDAIWDAAGDLAVGTGADTAGRLASGAVGTILTGAGVGSSPTWAALPVRIVWGMISSAGSVSRGTGFTVVRTSLGLYTVTITVPFSAAPIAVGTLDENAFSGQSLTIDSAAAGTIVFRTASIGIAQHDIGFMFILAGL